MTCGRGVNAPLLDQISDPHNTVITADAPHCQRVHVTHLAQRRREIRSLKIPTISTGIDFRTPRTR